MDYIVDFSETKRKKRGIYGINSKKIPLDASFYEDIGVYENVDNNVLSNHLTPEIILKDFFSSLPIDSRGNRKLDCIGHRAKSVTLAAISVFSAAFELKKESRTIIKNAEKILFQFLPPKSRGKHLQLALDVIREIKNPKKKWLKDKNECYLKRVDSLYYKTRSLDISRRELLITMMKFAIPIIAGIYCWPKKDRNINLNIGVVTGTAEPFLAYFQKLSRLLESVIRGLGRSLKIKYHAVDYYEAFDVFNKKGNFFDIVMLDHPWINTYRDSEIYHSEPIPFTTNTMIFLVNEQHKNILASLKSANIDKSVSLTDILKFASVLKCKSMPGPALPGSRPHKLANLLLQLDSSGGNLLKQKSNTIPPDLFHVFKSITKHAIMDPSKLDTKKAIKAVLKDEASFSLCWISNLLSLNEYRNDNSKNNLMVFPFAGGCLDGTWYLAVRSTSKHPEISRLITRLLAMPVDVNLMNRYGLFPPIKKVKNDLKALSNKMFIRNDFQAPLESSIVRSRQSHNYIKFAESSWNLLT